MRLSGPSNITGSIPLVTGSALAAVRLPAYAERLKQRDIVAWIGLEDGSIGHIPEFRAEKVRSRKGSATETEVTTSFKDAEIALQAVQETAGAVARASDGLISDDACIRARRHNQERRNEY